MGGDHSPRPVRSFLSFLGFERRSPSPSPQPHSSSAHNDTSQYEPHRPTSALPPQIQINGLPSAQLTTTDIVSSQPSFADNYSNARTVSPPPPSPPLSPSPSPSPPHRDVAPTDIDLSSNGWLFDNPVTNDADNVLPNVYLNQRGSSQLVNQSPPLPSSTPQHGEVHHLIHQPLQYNTPTLPLETQPYTNASVPPQSTRIYPAPSGSVNHDYSTGAQHHLSYHANHRTLRQPRTEQVTEPGTQFTQPSFAWEQISVSELLALKYMRSEVSLSSLQTNVHHASSRIVVACSIKLTIFL